MSKYAYEISTLQGQIGGLNNDILLAETRRVELQGARNQLKTEKETLETNKELLDSPETGESGSTGTHANNHEDSERQLIRNSHANLPAQVQEMMDAIDSQRDSIKETVESKKSSINAKKSRISFLRDKQRQANNN
ncbi:DUF5082 family protein [Bacillus sp. FSL W7-1360]